jgi:hypothetical protein
MHAFLVPLPGFCLYLIPSSAALDLQHSLNYLRLCRPRRRQRRGLRRSATRIRASPCRAEAKQFPRLEALAKPHRAPAVASRIEDVERRGRLSTRKGGGGGGGAAGVPEGRAEKVAALIHGRLGQPPFPAAVSAAPRVAAHTREGMRRGGQRSWRWRKAGNGVVERLCCGL